jgi:hypothetical protein
MNYEEKAKKIVSEWYGGVSPDIGDSELLYGLISHALREAYEAGRAMTDKDTPSEYVRGYQQGLRVAREETKELIEALQNLLSALYKCHKDQEYYLVWRTAQELRGAYGGPTYDKEMIHAREILKKWRDKS